MKKTFKIVTTVVSVKTIDYVIEANSEEEALNQVRQGEERGEGEEVDDEIDWSSEVINSIDLIEEL
jgi:hypothetical protein